MKISCKIINFFTVPFNQFNASLLNKNIKPNHLNININIKITLTPNAFEF